MAVTIQLKKPLYEWRSISGQNYSDLFLRADVEKWLVEQNVGYRTFTSDQTKADGKTYRYFHLKIEDENTAMLFKLTWI